MAKLRVYELAEQMNKTNKEILSILKDKGIETEEIRLDEYTSTRFVFFRDPDGLPLELHE